MNTPPIKSGQITEAEFNSVVSEPWVSRFEDLRNAPTTNTVAGIVSVHVEGMHTEEGFAQVNVRREPVSLKTQVLRILKWLGIVLVVACVVALGVKGL